MTALTQVPKHRAPIAPTVAERFPRSVALMQRHFPELTLRVVDRVLAGVIEAWPGVDDHTLAAAINVVIARLRENG